MSTATERLPEERDSAGKITLPPPDWSAPRPVGALYQVSPPEPLTRRLGRAPAVEGALRAELAAARAARDTARERVALSRFSRWLAAHGRSWDEAIQHARRALGLGEDEALRHELSGWLEGLGEAAAAAEVLDSLATSGTRDPVEAVRLLLHMGVLEARAGNAKAAAASFARAARLDPGEALASELLGTLGSWAPGAVLPSEAAESYVEAAGRRHTAQALDAQMEDLLRAFDVDPTSSVAVAALATALTERGRPLGADEVWRAHAAALRPTDEKRSRAVQARRRLQARAAGDLARALGAALDEGLDSVFGSEVGDFMDDLLLRAGLLEPLVARLEIRAESAPRLTRAALFEEIGRLEGGPLANADRAACARVAALQADPTREDALAALRAYASETRNATELVEALLRAIVIPDDSVSPASRAATARSLAVIADEALADPVLAAWALRMAGDPEIGEAVGRRSDALETYQVSRDRLESLLAATTGEEHVAALRELAGVLRSFPDDGARNAEVLAALVVAAPGERRWYVEAIRLAFRRQAYPEVLGLARAVRDRPAPPLQDIIDAALAEASARRAMKDFTGANETTRGLVAKAPDDPRALAVAWMNASLAGDRETRSHAIEQLAKFAAASVRAVMYALAAETRALIGDREAPRHLAERACHTDPSSARAVSTLADAAVGAHDRTAASALERGIHFLFARSSWCRGLAEALDAMGEHVYAVGWTQRLVALRPGDRKAMAALLERVARTRDGARIAEALVWVLAQPQPAAVLADLVVAPLRDLVAVEAPRAVGVARRALEVFGAHLPHVREAVLAAADAAGDTDLAVQAIERAIAVAEPEMQQPLLLALRARYHAAGSADGEARALLALTRLDADVGLTPSVLELRPDALSEDGALYRLGALAVLASREQEATPQADAGFAQTLRDLGAAQWDLAGDHEGAQHSLWRAAMANPVAGLATFAFDLAQLGGAAFALDSLEQRIDDESSDPRAATMAGETARVALVLGEPSRALDFAITALARNPRMAEALETAETAAMQSGREIELTRVYDDLTVRALGRFARRAVNYRAARFFEKQSDDGLALKHAARAFQAVPSEGAALLLLIRTAERAGDRAQAVGAMVQVAENTRDKGLRFAWLLRASAAAGSDEQGLALRVDVLLQALTVSRDPRASQALQLAARELLRTAPEERASLELRLARASKMVLAKADGPEGARLGLCFTRMALELFGDPRWASEALASSLTADADLDDYETLQPYATLLATGGEVEPLFALAVRAYTNVGIAAFRLLARIAEVRGENQRAADLWSRAAMRDPEDAALVRQADLALRDHGGDGGGDEIAWARLRKAVPDDERARMFLEHAEARQRDGSLDEAARAFERAAELSPTEDRPAIEGELRAVYEASGHADRVEQRALAEAGDVAVPPARRAACWGEVAHLREMRGDAPGALLALLSATALDATSLELWEGLERLATAAGDDDARVAALRARSQLAPAPDRVVLLKSFARALEARDEFQEAEEVWRRVALDDPDDEEADHALEALISALRNYAGLAVHLERRTARLAKLSGAREALRAVRLRRAAILEQRLGRTRDACAELALVLEESPDNVSALSYLADLHERLEEFASAVPIWRRVALLSRDPSTQAELELRAAHAALRAKDFAGALGSAKEVLLREPGRRDATELRAAAARALGDDEELGSALEDLAASVSLEPRMRSDALVEASYAATRLGREHLALERARRAAEVAPERMATQILARALEYRLHGPGAPDEAAVTLAQLDAVAEEADPEEVAILAFLRAEALDVVSSDGSGLVVLREAIATAGPRALLSLGIAERLAASGDATNALPAFEAALLGDLHGFRDRGRVAFTAGEAALRMGRDEVAVTLLREAALASPVFRPSALLKAAQILVARGDMAGARALFREAAEGASGDDRARALAQLARLERDSGDPDGHARAIMAFEAAILAATPASPLAVQLTAERGGLESTSREAPLASAARWGGAPLEAPAYALSGPDSLRREPVTFGDAAPADRPFEARPLSNRPLPVLSPAPPPPTSLDGLERDVANATTAEERAEAQLALARAHLEAGSHDAALVHLEAALELGAREPGEVLASLYQSTNRLADVVRVRRSLLSLSPGEFGALDALRSAASADRNHPYSRALEHVARLFDAGASPVAPPPLGAQVVLPGFLSFLTRSAGDRVAQALALVWEDGHGAWGKDAIGVLQGAQPAATTNAEVARIYESAISLLGLPRVPLFLRPSDHPPVGGVSMTWPPAAVLTGRVREDTPELRYALGQALALTLPSNIITLGLSPTDARQAFRGIMGAFGPPESSRSMNKESGRLAEALWHVLPPRTQRRLQALLAPVQQADFEAAPGRAWQSAHRVGLFLAGDLRTAVTAVLSSYAGAHGDGSETANLYGADWTALCRENASVADLFSLAVAPEYAEARWHPVSPTSSNRPSRAPVSR